jgi:hypothetical protein
MPPLRGASSLRSSEEELIARLQGEVDTLFAAEVVKYSYSISSPRAFEFTQIRCSIRVFQASILPREVQPQISNSTEQPVFARYWPEMLRLLWDAADHEIEF